MVHFNFDGYVEAFGGGRACLSRHWLYVIGGWSCTWNFETKRNLHIIHQDCCSW